MWLPAPIASRGQSTTDTGQVLNHYTSLNLTKLDILDKFPKIKVCCSVHHTRPELLTWKFSWQIAVAYKYPGTDEELVSFPADLKLLGRVEVVYHEMEGWNQPTTHVKKYEDLPQQARAYIEFISNHVGVRVEWIGTGPKREDMIVRT